VDDADAAQAIAEWQEGALHRYLRGIRARLRPAACGPRACLGCGHDIDARRLTVLPGACLCFECQAEAEGVMGR
jgi:RNA polymerase-binding transcription factor DksA